MRHHLKQGIARRVASGVVDDFEIIQIQAKQGSGSPIAGGIESSLESWVELRAVEQMGQGIAFGQKGELRFQAATFCDVGTYADHQGSRLGIAGGGVATDPGEISRLTVGRGDLSFELAGTDLAAGEGFELCGNGRVSTATIGEQFAKAPTFDSRGGRSFELEGGVVGLGDSLFRIESDDAGRGRVKDGGDKALFSFESVSEPVLFGAGGETFRRDGDAKIENAGFVGLLDVVIRTRIEGDGKSLPVIAACSHEQVRGVPVDLFPDPSTQPDAVLSGKRQIYDQHGPGSHPVRDEDFAGRFGGVAQSRIVTRMRQSSREKACGGWIIFYDQDFHRCQ